jgi:ABC-type branched-subunit amino acid transport system substrate-binding protein
MTRTWISGAVVGLVALTGCGSKDKPGDDPSLPPPAPAVMVAPPAAGGGSGVTDTEIVLGEPAGFTGPSAGLAVEQWRGIHAAVEERNDAGGVNGRKIRVVLADDGYEAERAAPAVVKLITEAHVFALFAGVGTPTIVKALPVVKELHNKDGLFYFANFTGAQPQRNPPYFDAVFNVRASYQQETKAMVDAFLAAGHKRIGTFVQDDAYGIDGNEGVTKALAAAGLSVAASARYPRGQTYDASNAAQVKILKDAGVDAIVMVGSYQACAGMIRDVRESGWMVPIDSVSFVGANQMLDLLVAEETTAGMPIVVNLISTQVVPFYDDVAIPLVKDYRAAIDKYDRMAGPPDFGDASYRPKDKYSFGSIEGYMDTRAFIAVLDKAGRDVSRKTFYDTAESMGQFDLGLGVPAELSKTRHQVLDKVWFTVATKSGWKSTDDPMGAIK